MMNVVNPKTREWFLNGLANFSLQDRIASFTNICKAQDMCFNDGRKDAYEISLDAESLALKCGDSDSANALRSGIAIN